VTLIAVILVSEQIIDARRLAKSEFFLVLAVAVAYAALGLLLAILPSRGLLSQRFARAQPSIDLILLAGLCCTSGGAFSDVRKAFFVVPLAAAFSERPSRAASWSLLSVAAFSLQAAIAQGRPAGAANSWLQLMLNHDLYLAWTAAAAAMLALALRRRSAQIAELADSRQHLVTQAIASVECERTRLAGALHDSPLQNLIAARHDLRRAQRTADPQSFRRLGEAIDVTIAELREEIFNLHPHVLDHAGLGAALEQVARRHSDEVERTIAIEIDDGADREHRQVLFALGRELLDNAVKHAEASHIALRVRRDPSRVVLTVSDDGRGIPAGRQRQALLDGHVGLASVHERVNALHGTLIVSSSLGGGTSIRLTLPVAPEAVGVDSRLRPSPGASVGLHGAPAAF
jgi:two-component system NarL family sensor kinase